MPKRDESSTREISRWQSRLWKKAQNAMYDEVLRVHGKEAADKANYGWGDASSGKRVSISTKMYVEPKTQVLQTTAEFPSESVDFDWDDYENPFL